MRIVLHLVMSLGLLCCTLPAQCTPLPGTGCTGQLPPVCGTPPQTGTNFVWRCAPTCFGTGVTQLTILGLPLTTPILINPPLACTATPCTLECQPTIVASQPGMTIAIPNNPSLVGAVVCIQCGCVNSSLSCLSLTQASKVTIL